MSHCMSWLLIMAYILTFFITREKLQKSKYVPFEYIYLAPDSSPRIPLIRCNIFLHSRAYACPSLALELYIQQRGDKKVRKLFYPIFIIFQLAFQLHAYQCGVLFLELFQVPRKIARKAPISLYALSSHTCIASLIIIIPTRAVCLL